MDGRNQAAASKLPALDALVNAGPSQKSFAVPPNLHTSYVAVNRGLPDRIHKPDFPVAMWASSLLFFIPNRSASALVHPRGTRSNV